MIRRNLLLSGHSRFWRALTAFTLVVTSVGCSSSPLGDRSNATLRPGANEPAATEPGAVGSIRLEGAVFDLAYDPTGDRIWWAVFRFDGIDELFELDPVTRAVVSTIRLPDVEYNGYTSRLFVDRDLVWISEPYRLIRFDPQTGETVVVEFDRSSPDPTADPSAPAPPLPGSWVTSFAWWDGSLWVARNNTPTLTRVDPATMVVVDTLAIPAAAAGAEDMHELGDGLLLTGSYTSDPKLWVVDASGAAEQLASGARRLVSSPDGIVGYGGSSIVDVAGTSGTFGDVHAFPGSPTDRLAMMQGTSDFVAYSGVLNSIVRLSNGAIVSRLGLGRTSGSIVNPLGEPVEVWSEPLISDLVVDIRGTVWFVNASSGQLIEARL